jgi:hypothetical protein
MTEVSIFTTLIKMTHCSLCHYIPQLSDFATLTSIQLEDLLLQIVASHSDVVHCANRTVNLGGTVATVGFPDPSLQGF